VARSGDSVHDRLVVLGRVSGVYGVRGWVRIRSFTDPVEALLDYRRCRLIAEGRPPLRLAEGRRHGKGLVARFDGIDDRDAAAGLIGGDVAVERRSMPDPGPDSWYWADLEGLEVVRECGEIIGNVDHLIQTGANDVLVVRGETEVLIPFVTGSVIKGVDLAAGRIVVDWDWE